MDASPLVSVIIATYNQEKIIGRAIESALAQQTAFSVEIIVGEDCSTDRTREVVSGYAARYPGRVRVLCNEKNLFIHRNMISMMTSSRAKYIAWLDGDDYWTDAGKLQKQISFLETNPGFAACTHNVRVLTIDGKVSDPCYPAVPPGCKSLEELIVEDFVATPSMVFRNTLVGRVPEWYYKQDLTDWPLWLVLSLDGPFMHFPDIMADYILHPNSTWSRRDRVYQLGVEIGFYRSCQSFLPASQTRLIRACEGIRHERMSREQIRNHNWTEARQAARLAVTVPHWSDNKKDKLRILLDSHVPALMRSIRRMRGIA